MRAGGWSLPSVVVAMPAHDEEGLCEFLREIDAHLRPHTAWLRYVVVDDASTCPVAVPVELQAEVDVIVNETNLGHGPSVLRAYRAAADLDPDVVVHVDGDGQFHGPDFTRLVGAMHDGDGVVGARLGRTDPWFRRVLTRALSLALGGSAGVDVNTPMRAYTTPTVRLLLARVPATSLVPHVHWTRLHVELGLRVRVLGVRSRDRRGSTAVGTTWRKGLAPWLPSRRLVWFVARALLELSTTRARGANDESVPEVLDGAAA